MANWKHLKEELRKCSDGRCACCGEPLAEGEFVIEHIFPKYLGGSEDIENLRLLCNSCSMRNANRTIHEREFQQYLKQILIQDPRFKNVKSDVSWQSSEENRQIFDLTFTKEVEGKEQLFIVEVKMMKTATAERIDSVIRQMQGYRLLVPNAHLVLAVPIILADEYQNKIKQEGFLLWDRETLYSKIRETDLPHCKAPDQFDEMLKRLRQCPMGFKDWRIYQKLMGDILAALFCPPLDLPSEQNADGNYANRRDFILPNYAESGYWRYLRERYCAEFVLVDAKNSGSTVTKDDILQVSHYLKERGLGMFGLIFSRVGANEKSEVHLRDIWEHEGKMLLILNDGDVEQMLLSRQGGNDPSRLLIEKIQEFRQKI